MLFENLLFCLLVVYVFFRSNDLTLIGCTTAIQKIIGSMAEFMSPFVPKILETISVAEHLAEKLSCSQLMVKVNDLKEHCGNLISPRVLFPAIQSWFIENLISNKVSLTKKIFIYTGFTGILLNPSNL